jgi:C-methyltransferase C-terminal domain/Putative zinc binding domain/Methyltransferase domain
MDTLLQVTSKSEESQSPNWNNQSLSPSQVNACRCCGWSLHETFADLGVTPMANALLQPGTADSAEPLYPLHAYVCDNCHLVQLAAFESPQEIFGDYLYFSSFSDSWLKHAESYAGQMIDRFGLGTQSLVVEVASNDGYLLQYFKKRGVPVLGVDPAANVAASAISKGIETDVAFFGVETAQRLRSRGLSPKLMVANNVLAHVPDLHDFVEGFRVLLAAEGVATFEFPHLLRLMQQNQFDTIYHEHFSYLSFAVVQRLFAQHGLTLFDVEELPTHGGSIRIYVRHATNDALPITPAVAKMILIEDQAGLNDIATYREFTKGVAACKLSLVEFLLDARRRGKRVAAYGAPAKGNTLLNYCGIGPDLIAFTVDRSPHKQGLLLPGTRIPIGDPSLVRELKPDYLLVLPWNLRHEIAEQMADIREWGGQFIVAIPHLEVF